MPREEEKTPEAPQKKLPIKTIIVVAAALVIEAVAISAVFLLSGGPADVKAQGALDDELAANEKLVEISVVEDRFGNYKEGRLYLYEAKVFITVRKKYQEKVVQQVEQMKASITQDINTIVRQADPVHLTEPTLATLKRQIKASLDERLGLDENGATRIEDVLLPGFTKIRGDF